MRSSERFSLQGRRAIVTGASRGIGAAIAAGLAEAGADVFGFSRSGIPIVSSRWLYAAIWIVSMFEKADSIISTSVGLKTWL